MTAQRLHYLAYLVVAALAWMVARRDRGHRWLAAYITWMGLQDLTVRFVVAGVLEGAARPLRGWARVAFHVEHLSVLSWSFLFVALCLHYFAGRRPWPAFAGWAITFGFCLNYPLVSGDLLIATYHWTGLVSLGVTWACILWGIARHRELAPSLSHLVLILYAVTDVVINLVPYARGFLTEWPLVRVANFLLLGACAVAHVVWLARQRAPARAVA